MSGETEPSPPACSLSLDQPTGLTPGSTTAFHQSIKSQASPAHGWLGALHAELTMTPDPQAAPQRNGKLAALSWGVDPPLSLSLSGNSSRFKPSLPTMTVIRIQKLRIVQGVRMVGTRIQGRGSQPLSLVQLGGQRGHPHTARILALCV